MLVDRTTATADECNGTHNRPQLTVEFFGLTADQLPRD